MLIVVGDIFCQNVNICQVSCPELDSLVEAALEVLLTNKYQHHSLPKPLSPLIWSSTSSSSSSSSISWSLYHRLHHYDCHRERLWRCCWASKASKIWPLLIIFKVPGVFGSRMTGGGFGGCTVTLLKQVPFLNNVDCVNFCFCVQKHKFLITRS